jgi:hypothetical protein
MNQLPSSDAMWEEFYGGAIIESSPDFPATSESLAATIEEVCQTNGADAVSHLEAIVNGFTGGYPSNFIESCRRRINELRGGTNG